MTEDTENRILRYAVFILAVALVLAVVSIRHLSVLPSARLHCPAPHEPIWYPQTETLVCERVEIGTAVTLTR